MASMYEMIMDLPLLKGVGKEQISYFLEKTNVNFLNYNDGEVIADYDEAVQMVRFVITGEVEIIHSLESSSMSVKERAGFGKVLGAERLFGITTGYPYKVYSIGRSSVMEFSKEQYVNLLYSDRIYMLNFFNYLSLRAQRPVESLMLYSHGDIRGRLCELVSMLTDPGAKGVEVKGTDEALGVYCGKTPDEIAEWKRVMTEAGIICGTPGGISIKSRRIFLDFA